MGDGIGMGTLPSLRTGVVALGLLLAGCSGSETAVQAPSAEVVMDADPTAAVLQPQLPEGWSVVSESTTATEHTSHYRGDAKNIRIRAVPASITNGVAGLREKQLYELVDIGSTDDGILAEQSFGDGSHWERTVGFEEDGWYYEVRSWDVAPLDLVDFAQNLVAPVVAG